MGVGAQARARISLELVVAWGGLSSLHRNSKPASSRHYIGVDDSSTDSSVDASSKLVEASFIVYNCRNSKTQVVLLAVDASFRRCY